VGVKQYTLHTNNTQNRENGTYTKIKKNETYRAIKKLTVPGDKEVVTRPRTSD
jgi:hypothetical protein